MKGLLPLLLHAEHDQDNECADDKEANHSHDPIKVSPPLGAAEHVWLIGSFKVAAQVIRQINLTCALKLFV